MAGCRAVEQDRRRLLSLAAYSRLMAGFEQIPKSALLDQYLMCAEQERPFDPGLIGDSGGRFTGRFGGGQQADG